MLIPKKTKFKKQQKGRTFNKITGKIRGLDNLRFGSFALKAVESFRVSSKHLESLYQSINKLIKKSGRVTMRTFSHTPITKKPVEVRMGKGKGAVSSWVARVKAGSLLCEIFTTNKAIALTALRQAQMKMPINTKIITKIF
jgi:large subunit ribosomal protein L16